MPTTPYISGGKRHRPSGTGEPYTFPAAGLLPRHETGCLIRFGYILFLCVFLLFLPIASVHADMTVREAVPVVRSALKERAPTVTVEISAPVFGRLEAEADIGRVKASMSAISKQVYENAMQHTGNPDEGDALRFALKGARRIMTYVDGDTGSISFLAKYIFSYYDTPAQERAAAKKIRSVTSRLIRRTMDNTAKLRKIYRYVTSHVRYAMRDTNRAHSAYGAVIRGRAFCDGYALLLYRMCLRAKIPCRIIEGEADGGAGRESHAWNIVHVNGKWYNCDPTWDASLTQAGEDYAFFLSGSKIFRNHFPAQIYRSHSFRTAHPVAAKSSILPKNWNKQRRTKVAR